MWNLRTLAECVLDAPQDHGINVGLARDLARAAIDADAKLARLAGLEAEIALMRRSIQAAGTWEQFYKDYTAFKTGRAVIGAARSPQP